MEAGQARSWTADVPVAGATGGGFGIQLALDQPVDAGSGAAAASTTLAFTTLGDSGRFSRVLLARLAAADGNRTIRLLAVKLQRDSYRSQTAAAAALVDNREIDAMWRREFAEIDRLAGCGGPLTIVRGPADGVVPPLALDRRTGRVFPVLCPRSWRPLVTCRDDALLRESGLEPFSGSTERYLLSRGADGAATFYTWSLDAGQQPRGVTVRRRHELFADLVAAWGALQDGGRQQVRREQPALAAVLAELAVAEPGEAAAAERLAQRLVPICYYDSWFVVTPLCDLQFDEYCDLVGGAEPADVLGDALPPGRASAVAGVKSLLSREGQWVTAPWTPPERVTELVAEPVRLGRFALEVLWLKLQAFARVCRIVREFHATGCPHLGLSSDNVMLRYLGGELPAPVRWCFEPGLVDLGASHRRVLDGVGADLVGEVALPATDAVSTFLSPWLTDSDNDRTLAMQATVVPAEVDGHAAMRIELRSQRERITRVRPGDVVRIEPDAALGATGEQPLVLALESVEREVMIGTLKLPAGAGAMAAEQRIAATVTFHQRPGPPSDLFALGMLLGRAVLVHDGRDHFAVRDFWDQLLDRLETMLGGAEAPDPARVEGALRSLFEGERANLDSAAVLWPRALREVADVPVPPAIWRDVLRLIARLLTGYDGFSFATHHGDFAPEAPAAPAAAVCAEVDEILTAVQVELFDREVRDAELDALGRDFKGRVSATMVKGGGDS
ncbi:MAG: hypothetical protein NXI31_07185 [bacterium]|nr:hypothetical protein [bacterium]